MVLQKGKPIDVKNLNLNEWKAEVEYLFKTGDGKLFQPVLKRILNEKGEIVWGD